MPEDWPAGVLRNRQITCYNCGKLRHIVRNCRSAPAARGTQQHNSRYNSELSHKVSGVGDNPTKVDNKKNLLI